MRICDERELADDEGCPADLDEAAVEPASVVAEDPEPRDLAGEPLRIDRRVGAGDPQKHDQSELDLPGHGPVDLDPGP